MNLARRVYRWLTQAFPHEFKLAYGSEVTQIGEDVLDEIAKRHGAGLIRLIADIAIRVPLEYLSEMRGDMRNALRALMKSPGFCAGRHHLNGGRDRAVDKRVQLEIVVTVS